MTSRLSSHCCQVAVPVPLRRLFDYRCQQDIAVGTRVLVPFGRRKLVGVVLSNLPATTSHQLKHVLKVLDQDQTSLDSQQLDLLRWASQYYHHPVGEVIQAALPAVLRSGVMQENPCRYQVYCTTSREPGDLLKHAPVQLKLLDFINKNEAVDTTRIGLAFKNWRTSLKSLIDKQLVELQSRLITLPQSPPTSAEYALTAEQREAVSRIDQLTANYATLMLHGITGSGKTEVYLQAASRQIEAGRQVLFLVPEIALTPQWISRVRERLGDAVVVLHSGLSDRQRYLAWWQARCGDAVAVLGTRSAIFTPLKRPGLIIIDEEHDNSFKQQDGFRYHARDLAIKLASLLSIPVVPGSATPSLESIHNYQAKLYTGATLSRRIGSARLPAVGTIDLKIHPANDALSQPLLSAIAARIKSNEQVIVFLNRRGFAPLLQCQPCGWQATCDRCDAFLVLHKAQHQLRCHHCGHSRPLPAHCPQCENSKLYQIGAGTQRIHTALEARFPQAGIIRLDRDQITTQIQLEAALTKIRNHEVDILVGTQLISKGHDFPAVTLVGVVNADQGLYSTDFRSREHLFQQLLQVGGRAGRAQHPGEVLIQTSHPEDPFFDYLRRHDYNGYAESMLIERQQALLPPFSRLALFRAESTSQDAPLTFLRWLAGSAVQLQNTLGTAVEILDPVASPMTRRSGRYRAQLLLRSEKRRSLHSLLDRMISTIESSKQARRIRWSIDIDPVDLF